MPGEVDGLGSADGRLEAMAPQAGRLRALIDPRLVWLCLALLAVDLFFVAVHTGHSIYVSLYYDRVPILGWRWDIGYDRSYLETFGYLKMLTISALLIGISERRERPVYLAFAVIFVVAALDDALELHETLGEQIADAIGLGPFAGLRPVDVGELIFWAGIGVPLLALAAVAFVRTRAPEDRANGLLLLGALAALALFAVGVDMIHVKFEHAFRGAGLLLTVIEEGGQQITLSLTLGLAILIRRELRTR